MQETKKKDFFLLFYFKDIIWKFLTVHSLQTTVLRFSYLDSSSQKIINRKFVCLLPMQKKYFSKKSDCLNIG